MFILDLGGYVSEVARGSGIITAPFDDVAEVDRYSGTRAGLFFGSSCCGKHNIIAMPLDTSSIVPASCDVLWFELLVITAGHRALTARVIIVTDDGYRRRTRLF